MIGLQGFSDWVLALLPRLFLYPGGLGLVAAFVVFRLAQGGLVSLKPEALAQDLDKAPLLSLAVAWTTLSLISLPGASPLAAPVDTLVLVALVLISFSLDKEATFEREGWISAAMALAVLVSTIRGHTLTGYVPASGVSSLLAIFCIAIGVVRLSGTAQTSPAAVMRWIVWVGLGFGSLLSSTNPPGVPGILWTMAMYAIAFLVLNRASRLAFAATRGKRTTDAFTIAVWSLAALALVAALLGW